MRVKPAVFSAAEWLTTSQAAHRLGITTQRVDQLARAGTLAFQVTPLGRLFSVRDVDALRAEREAKAQPDAPDPAAATVSVLDSSD